MSAVGAEGVTQSGRQEAQCYRMGSDIFWFPEKICGPEFICAGDKVGGKDACKGDSGGPLMYNVFGRYVLGGIVSTGHGCGQSAFPGIYSAVAPVLQWIRDVAFV